MRENSLGERCGREGEGVGANDGVEAILGKFCNIINENLNRRAVDDVNDNAYFPLPLCTPNRAFYFVNTNFYLK